MKNGASNLKVKEPLTVSRRTPPRWDIRVEAALSASNLSRRRLALQIRQDMWRALQSTRGFLPAVEVSEGGGLYHIAAGGDLDGTRAPKGHMEAKIADLLADPAHVNRWKTHAKRRVAA